MTKARINDLTAPSEEARSFDAWFFSQPKKAQEKMRNAGVLPYREMVQSRHVFKVKDEHVRWMRWVDQRPQDIEHGFRASFRYFFAHACNCFKRGVECRSV